METFPQSLKDETIFFSVPESPAYGDITRDDRRDDDEMLTISWSCSQQETQLLQSTSNINMNDTELPTLQNKVELNLIDI